MKHKIKAAVATLALAGAGTMIQAQGIPGLAPAPEVAADGTIVTPSFQLPFSSFASSEARAAFIERQRHPMPIVMDIAKTRQISDERAAPMIAKMREMYPVRAIHAVIGGVPTDTYEPQAGIAPQNKNRVLINLHGGGFVTGGGGIGGALESIPLSSTGRIRVVSVDYRLAPEHKFPAGSEDVEAVYRELLKTYKPENIGIYGCSAGGMLAAQAVAWFQKVELPRPGAIGVFCASLHTFGEGDSAQLWPRMGSVIRIVPPAMPEGSFGRSSPYMAGETASNPLLIPAASKEVMRKFPPTLFMTGTRAPETSGAAMSHIELLELGVKSELLLFDGMDHGFYADPSLPESQRAYRLINMFFAQNLGHKPAAGQ